jgi:hypothetical protein
MVPGMGKPLYWRIQGYDGFETIFKTRVKLGQFTEDQIKDLLRALTAKASLTFDEIVGAYARRRTKIANDLLHVHKDSAHSTYMCGSNPHFAASVVDADNKIIKPPPLT